ncbi:MAG TPA: hypothetical protein VGE12_11250 [Noviherbaspirillum sp.]
MTPLLLLKGCAILPADFHDRAVSRSEPRTQRENMLQAAWRGRPYNSLVEKFGAPRMVMNVPGYRQLKTSVVVYDDSDAVSRCIDAFTVVVLHETEEVVVSDYFCR